MTRWYWLGLQLAALAAGIWAGVRIYLLVAS